MKKIWKYPDEMLSFVQEHGHEGTIEEMRQQVNERFGLSLDYGQMKSYFSNHKIHSAPKKGRKAEWASKYPKGMEDFVRSIAKGKSSKELTDAVNAKYGEGTITVAHMKAYKKNHGINTGLTGRFEKGHVPPNKGKKLTPEQYKKMAPTMFKKGQTPHNGGTPVGEIRLRKPRKNRPGDRPYYWQKVAQPNVWRMRHVVVWEEHNGPVPDGCMITFADNNSLNCDISNLILETKGQHAIKNAKYLHFPKSYDMESAKALNQLADLKMATTKAKKKRRKRCRSTKAQT